MTETGGVYRVTATFAVTESAQTVMAVLTDYERIPKYMPDMEVSRVIERTPAGAVVEQQATSKFMMFSKRVHLVLEIREDASSIRFRDRCGKSFASYRRRVAHQRTRQPDGGRLPAELPGRRSRYRRSS